MGFDVELGNDVKHEIQSIDLSLKSMRYNSLSARFAAGLRSAQWTLRQNPAQESGCSCVSLVTDGPFRLSGRFARTSTGQISRICFQINSLLARAFAGEIINKAQIKHSQSKLDLNYSEQNFPSENHEILCYGINWCVSTSI